MEFTRQILEDWGFETNLIDVFIENNIDEDLFPTLNENDIKELIPSLGTRKKFIKKYHEYLIEHAIEKPAVIAEEHDTSSGTLEDTLSVQSSSTLSSTNSSIIDLDTLRPQLFYPCKARIGQPYIITSYTTDPSETVRRLLDNSDEGLIIKNSYGQNKKFQRNSLCNLIVRNELKNSVDKKISTQRFVTLAKEINDIFIHEEASIYYLPYTKGNDGKVVAARGKLWSAYVHQRQMYKKAGLLIKVSNQPGCSHKSHESDEEDDDSDNLVDILLWLENNSEPFTEVLSKWQRTAKVRLHFNSKNETIDEYFNKYPALGKQTGHILLNSDFNFLHENKENFLFHGWPVVSNFIYDALKNKKDSYLKELMIKAEEEEVTDDAKQIIAVKYLPLLLQAPLIKAKGKKHWKPSKQELIDGFILFINDIVDLNPTLEKRVAKYNTYKLTAQPIPVIVGTSWGNLQSYVSVNNVLYKVDSFLKAVDLCFKIFHALNANFPAESEPAWLFMQQGIYKITNKVDKKFASVQSLISDVNIALNT